MAMPTWMPILWLTKQCWFDRGLSRDPESMLSAGIFQIPIANEAVLQAMFEEVKAGL